MIRKQIRSAVTDTGETKAGEMSLGISNLFSLLKASKSPDYSELLNRYEQQQLPYSELKEAVADSVIKMVLPLQERKKELLEDRKAIKESLKQSVGRIRARAAETVREVKMLTGLSN